MKTKAIPISALFHDKDAPLVVTVSEAAKIMGIGKNTVYELVNSGQLKSIRVGRQIRINHQELLKFLGIDAG